MIRVYYERPEWPLVRRTAGASGYDLHANLGTPRTIEPGRRWTIPLGVRLAMEPGVEAQVRPRSGLWRDHGVWCPVGTIDSDFRGEVCVTLHNAGHQPYQVLPGDRVAQLVFARVITSPHGLLIVAVDDPAELGVTDRGTSGHGSTGR